MQSTKVIMILWVKWKKPVKSAITIDPKDEGNPMDVKGDIADNDTVEPLYSGRLVIADTFLWHPPNHGQTLIEKPYIANTFMANNCHNGHNFLEPRENIKPNLPLHSKHPIFFVIK